MMLADEDDAYAHQEREKCRKDRDSDTGFSNGANSFAIFHVLPHPIRLAHLPQTRGRLFVTQAEDDTGRGFGLSGPAIRAHSLP